MLNAVLFDLDNTLVDRDQAFRECVAKHFANPAVRAELSQLDGRGHGDRDTLFQAWTRYAGTSMNQSTLGQLIAGCIRPDCELLKVLRTISATVKMGIITNGSGEAQRAKFHAAGLAQVISPNDVWVSAEVGTAKPDPAIFLLAGNALGVRPGNCIFIGDHEQNDLAGAAAAGMRARLVDGPLNAERLNRLWIEERVR